MAIEHYGSESANVNAEQFAYSALQVEEMRAEAIANGFEWYIVKYTSKSNSDAGEIVEEVLAANHAEAASYLCCAASIDSIISVISAKEAEEA